MLFFVTVVAQTIFATLPIDVAGHVLSHLFPLYYTLTALLCVASFVASLGMYPSPARKWLRAMQSALGLASALIWISWLVFLPIMDRIQSHIPSFSGPPTPLIERFFMYHGISMLFNIIAMLLVLFSLIIHALVAER